jgi:predicted dehydrogenase
MILAAKVANKILTVNQNYRYHSYYQKISEVMASGKLGEIVQIRIAIHQFSRRWDWQTLRKNNGGILTNHGAHALDWLLLHITDDDPEVFCHLVNTPLYAGDADSHAKVIIRPKNGPLVDLELSHCNAYPQDNFLVMGTQGSLSGTRQSLHWKYFEPDKEKPLELDPNPTQDRSYNSEALHFSEESIELSDAFNDDMGLFYKDVFASLREDKPLKITAESVRRQIRIFDKCRASASW